MHHIMVRLCKRNVEQTETELGVKQELKGWYIKVTTWRLITSGATGEVGYETLRLGLLLANKIGLANLIVPRLFN